jgi:hypothetical protein
MRLTALLSGLVPSALAAFDGSSEVTDESPFAADSPSVEAFGKFSVVAQVKHEHLSEVLGGRGSRIRGNMPVWGVIPTHIGVMVGSERALEGNTAEQSPVRVSESMSIFMTQDIPQRRPRGTHKPIKQLSERNGRNVDISTRPIPTPAIGISAPTQIHLHSG